MGDEGRRHERMSAVNGQGLENDAFPPFFSVTPSPPPKHTPSPTPLFSSPASFATCSRDLEAFQRSMLALTLTSWDAFSPRSSFLSSSGSRTQCQGGVRFVREKGRRGDEIDR